MPSFLPMVPPKGDAESGSLGGEERVAFVRDGFSWIAFVIPVFWLLWHRLWVEAAVVFAFTLGIGTLGGTFQAPGATVLVSLLVQFGVGLEGQSWRLARLRRRGWREAGAVQARDVDEAEMRFFAARAEVEPPAPAAPPAARSFSRPTPGAAPAPLGLIGYKG